MILSQILENCVDSINNSEGNVTPFLLLRGINFLELCPQLEVVSFELVGLDVKPENVKDIMSRTTIIWENWLCDLFQKLFYEIHIIHVFTSPQLE